MGKKIDFEINGHGGSGYLALPTSGAGLVTQHAFFNNDRPQVYNKAAAELAWRRSLDFLNISNN